MAIATGGYSFAKFVYERLQQFISDGFMKSLKSLKLSFLYVICSDFLLFLEMKIWTIVLNFKKEINDPTTCVL